MEAEDILFVRLTEAEKRLIKTLAASQGLTLRQATLEAYGAWAEKLQSSALPGGTAQGVPARRESAKPGQPKRGSRVSAQQPDADASTSSGQALGYKQKTTPKQELRRADAGPSTAPGNAQVPSQEAPSVAWLHRVAQLDLNWSKCPAAERVHEKTGNVWVARGTRVPLSAIFDAVAKGEPFVEICEVFRITLQQLIAILQFAAEGLAAARPVK
jgi:Protein of unknown function (DUF433)